MTENSENNSKEAIVNDLDWDWKPSEEDDELIRPKYNGEYMKHSKRYEVSYGEGIKRFSWVQEKKSNGEIESKKVPFTISYVVVYPAKKLINVDTGQVMIEICFGDDRDTLNIKTISHIMSQKNILSARGVLELADYGLNLPDKKGRDLADYFSHILEKNKFVIPFEQMYESMGWKNNYTEFVWGSTKITKESEEKVTFNKSLEIINSYSSKGDIKEWLNITRGLLKYPSTRFRCYQACSAPIIEIIGEESKDYNNHGGTSIGKTTKSEVAMSGFGNPKMLNFTAEMTKVGLEEMLFLCNNLPVNFDDIQTEDLEKIKQMVYKIGNSGSKIKGTKEGGLAKMKRFSSIVLTTGETTINKDNAFGGAEVRAIDIEGGLEKQDEGIETEERQQRKKEQEKAISMFKDSMKDHYGHLAPLLIKKIIDKNENGELKKLYYGVKEKIKPKLGSGIRNRLTGMHASLIVSGMLFEEIMGELGEKTENPYNVCDTCLSETINRISNDTYGVRALREVYSWIDTKNAFFTLNRISYEKHQKEFYGNFDANNKTLEIYIFALKEMFKKAGFDYSAAFNEWKNSGYLHIDSGGKLSLKGLSERAININVEEVYKKTGLYNPLSAKVIDSQTGEFMGVMDLSGNIDNGLISRSL